MTFFSAETVSILLGLLSVGSCACLYGYLREQQRLRAEQQLSRRLAFLNKIRGLAVSTFDVEEMLGMVAKEIRRDFGHDYVGIGVVRSHGKDKNKDKDKAKQLEWQAEAGTASRLLGKPIPWEEGILGRVAREGISVLLQNGEPELLREGLLDNSRSRLCLPIRHDGVMLGVLDLESLQPNAFRTEEVEVVCTVAGYLADALQNATVFHRMQEQAIMDSLTGLKTRGYFSEALRAELKRAGRTGHPFSVLLLDLDNFKSVNDTQGHLQGDHILAELGKLLDSHSRRSNVVARYGGDEFVILMTEATTEQAEAFAERLRSWIASEPAFQKMQVTASFGIATFPFHGSTPEDLIQAADSGLYASKKRGGNCVSCAQLPHSPEELFQGKWAQGLERGKPDLLPVNDLVDMPG